MFMEQPLLATPYPWTVEFRLIMFRFAFQIFLSAFLLFQVQPIVARFILPDFGGASNVWTVCLVFFQVFLLVGYLYAYLLDRWLPPFKQALVHVVLVLFALIVLLPLDLGTGYQSTSQQSPQLSIVLLLVSSVGLPYALISSSGPLFQNWYRTKFPQNNTYRLYALSNIGSVLGLLSYPFLIEPLLTLHQQALFWSVGFVLYFFWTLLCLWSLRDTKSTASFSEELASDDRLSGTHIFVWICMASIATTLLLATTNKITMDVASVPFLWVLPLTLYLFSFIICFDRPQWYDRRFWIPLLFLVTFLGITALVRGATSTIYFQLFSYLAMLFVGCMVCHGELYRMRPNPRLLTRYYLVISLGGAIGGIFVAVLAPMLFSDYFELQLSWVALFLVSGLCIIASTHFRTRLMDLGAQFCWALWIAFLSIFLFANAATAKENVLHQVRGFYGLLKLMNYELPDDHPSGADRYLSLMHGAIVHGIEFYKGDEALFVPTSYFTEESGVGKAIAQHPDANSRALDVGVVGMGIASISALCKSCESLSFYEIDPNVVDFEDKWFLNLDSVRALGVRAEVFVGDGRKLLEEQLEQRAQPQYDVLAIDAFSGDSIPVHLLTKEAFELYRKHLRVDGVLAVHITNRHLDLRPVVASLASSLGLKAATVDHFASDDGLSYTSRWILLSDSEQFFSNIASQSVTVLGPMNGDLWTDEYSNLLNVLL